MVRINGMHYGVIMQLVAPLSMALAFIQTGTAGRLIADINLEVAKSAANDIMAVPRQPRFRVETMSRCYYLSL